MKNFKKFESLSMVWDKCYLLKQNIKKHTLEF